MSRRVLEVWRVPDRINPESDAMTEAAKPLSVQGRKLSPLGEIKATPLEQVLAKYRGK
jgi:hypothetical protein